LAPRPPFASRSRSPPAATTTPPRTRPRCRHRKPASGTPVNGVKYAFSQADSKVGFVGAKITGKHDGSFGTFSGVVVVPNGSVEQSSVTVDIDMTSLQVDEPKLAGHLKSPDFFDVGKFPKARFVSTSVRQGGELGATNTVTGNLELHGVTKSINIPATIHVRPDGVDVDAEFAINRKEFGVVYPGKPDDLIKDEVLLKLQIHANKV